MKFLIPQFIKRMFFKPQSDGARGFAAAAHNRLTTDWLASSKSLNEDIKSGGEKVRYRSREMEKNSEYYKQYLRLFKINVAGPTGFSFRPRVRTSKGKLDNSANDAIHKALKGWSKKKNCTVTGKFSFRQFQQILISCWARDGEGS